MKKRLSLVAIIILCTAPIFLVAEDASAVQLEMGPCPPGKYMKKGGSYYGNPRSQASCVPMGNLYITIINSRWVKNIRYYNYSSFAHYVT